MRKQNCWEHIGCGREMNGAKAEELGVCPAATEKRVDGMNGGVNGGRVCWAIAGTLCGGDASGTRAKDKGGCLRCDFYAQVHSEEGHSRVRAISVLRLLRAFPPP